MWCVVCLGCFWHNRQACLNPKLLILTFALLQHISTYPADE
jgi:hypothetical protein